MARRYATPAAFKAALEQRLRTRAAGDGLEFQRTRQFVVFDRFLARVFAEFEDAAVLKGGLALEFWLMPFSAAKSRMVSPDASIRSITREQAEVWMDERTDASRTCDHPPSHDRE